MPPSSPPARFELWTYRVLCLLGAVMIPLLGYTYHSAGLPFIDPMWARWGVGLLPLGVCVASFVSERARREIAGLSYVLLYVLIAWYGVVAAVNGLAAEYALGGLCLIVAVSVVASAGFARLLPLAAALGMTCAVLVAIAVTAEAPGVHPVVFISATGATAFTLFVGALLRLRLRELLRASERRYRTIFDQVADGVLLLEVPTLRVLAANAAYARMTGLDEKELRSRTLYDLADARPGQVDRDVQRAVEEGRTDLGECMHLRRDGTPLPLHIVLARVDRAGAPYLCLTAHDLTAQQQARSQVASARAQSEAMHELRTAFLNNMSHELRTPLVSLTGFLELLEEDDLNAFERREIVSSLRRSAARLDATLNAVLDLAQIEGGHADLNPEPVDLGSTAHEATLLFQDQARQKGIALEFRAGERARALVDRAAFHRIIVNLVSNAVKFTPTGRVDVEVGADSHRVFVRVRDTGVGIPKALVSHLFSAFRQGSSGLGREHEGSGLGLTLAKRLVDLMGGRIMVESVEGEGTAITVAFSRTWATPGVTIESGGAIPGSDGPPPGMPDEITALAARPRALVVEDNADTARLIQRLLSTSFEVDLAPDGNAALEAARRTWYDLILLDINLGPGIDGLSVLKRLRMMSAYAYVPVVAVTTYTAMGDRERFLAAGFNAYLPKPFDRKSLIAAVEHAYGACAQSAA